MELVMAINVRLERRADGCGMENAPQEYIPLGLDTDLCVGWFNLALEAPPLPGT
jgi:hypothetical protein